MRKLIVATAAATAILLAGYAGYRGYGIWKQNRLIEMARGFLAKSDTRNALLAIQQAVSINPASVTASRMMADLLEANRSPAAMLWRARVVQLEPGPLSNHLAQAQTAVAFHESAVANDVLLAVSEQGKTSAAYQNVAGAAAAAANHFTESEAYFAEAVRLDPTNPAPQLNLAVIRLHGTNHASLAEARKTLEHMSESGGAGLRCVALRELVTDAILREELDRAMGLAANLASQTNCTFADRMLRLEILRRKHSPEFGPALKQYEREAASNSANINELAKWQMTKMSPVEALTWLRGLPAAARTNAPVPLLIAECLTMQKDWRGLQSTLDGQNWAELEFIRHAFLARALREQNLGGAATGEWEQALNACNNRKENMTMLVELAAKWNWQTESEELLWNLVGRYPGEHWAVQSLTRSFVSSGRTRSLMRLYGQLSHAFPMDLTLRNNLAMTALLLDAPEIKPHELARDVYQKSPTNATYAATYAFSLHVQGKDRDALKLFESFNAKDLEQPSIAGYYGLILKANGDKARAHPYLAWAVHDPDLLPEERKLFQ